MANYLEVAQMSLRHHIVDTRRAEDNFLMQMEKSADTHDVKGWMAVKEDLLLSQVRNMSLRIKECPYCLANGGPGSRECSLCTYGKVKGICTVPGSKYKEIEKVRDELKETIRGYGSDLEESTSMKYEPKSNVFSDRGKLPMFGRKISPPQLQPHVELGPMTLHENYILVPIASQENISIGNLNFKCDNGVSVHSVSYPQFKGMDSKKIFLRGGMSENDTQPMKVPLGDFALFCEAIIQFNNGRGHDNKPF